MSSRSARRSPTSMPRQHIANQFEMVGRNFGASILSGKPANDMML